MPKLKFTSVYLLYVLSVLSLITLGILAEERLAKSLHDEEKRTSIHIERLMIAKELLDYTKRLNDSSQDVVSNQYHINMLTRLLNSESLVINTNQSNKLVSLIKKIGNNNKPDKEMINQLQAELLFNLIIQQEAEYLPSQRNTAPIYILFDKKWSGITLAIWISAMFTAFFSGVITYKLHIKTRNKKGLQ